MYLILLSGRAGSGKDTVADIICEEFGFLKVAFADPLRQLASNTHPEYRECVESLGYTKAKETHPFVRQYLIDLGEGIRALYPLFWEALAEKAIMQHAEAGVVGVVVSDTRRITEMAVCPELHPIKVRVVSDSFQDISHCTETDLDAYPVDAVVTNLKNRERSLERLREDVVSMVWQHYPDLIWRTQ